MGDAVTPGYHLATLRVGPSRRSWLEVVVLTRCARLMALHAEQTTDLFGELETIVSHHLDL